MVSGFPRSRVPRSSLVVLCLKSQVVTGRSWSSQVVRGRPRSFQVVPGRAKSSWDVRGHPALAQVVPGCPKSSQAIPGRLNPFQVLPRSSYVVQGPRCSQVFLASRTYISRTTTVGAVPPHSKSKLEPLMYSAVFRTRIRSSGQVPNMGIL